MKQQVCPGKTPTSTSLKFFEPYLKCLRFREFHLIKSLAIVNDFGMGSVERVLPTNIVYEFINCELWFDNCSGYLPS